MFSRPGKQPTTCSSTICGGKGYEQVYVIPPSVVKSSRGRYGNSGVRTDARDARLLADLLRTDLAQTASLAAGQPANTQDTGQGKSGAAHELSVVRRVTERLRAVLLRYYPGVIAAI